MMYDFNGMWKEWKRLGNNRSRNILIISGLFVMLLIAVFLIYNGRRRDYDERIVGFIMNGRIDETGGIPSNMPESKKHVMIWI